MTHVTASEKVQRTQNKSSVKTIWTSSSVSRGSATPNHSCAACTVSGCDWALYKDEGDYFGVMLAYVLMILALHPALPAS